MPADRAEQDLRAEWRERLSFAHPKPPGVSSLQHTISVNHAIAPEVMMLDDDEVRHAKFVMETTAIPVPWFDRGRDGNFKFQTQRK